MAAINYAHKVALGSGQASAVYLGSTKVWPPVPLSIAGCVIWLDATKLTMDHAMPAWPWPNYGNGPQPTLLGTPAPKILYNMLNGLPVVRTIIGEGQLRFAGTGIDKDYTLFIVAHKWRVTPGRVLAADATLTGGNNVLWGWHGTEFDSAYVEGWFNTPGPVGGITATMGWRLYSGDATAAGTARLFSNGVLLGSHPTPPPTKGFGGSLCLGGYEDTHQQDADSEIAEFVMYNRKLSDAERQQVEAYLRVKWAIPQPFKPKDLGPNLLGWFDGADAAVAVPGGGGGIFMWMNKPGVGAPSWDMTQSDGAKMPTYANSTMTFSGNQYFAITNSPAAYDFILVGKPYPPSVATYRTLLRSPTSAHQLITDSQPYMIRIGTYYGGFQPAGEVLPPAMTSNTAPAPYVASSSGEYPGGYEAYKAFDRNSGTIWHSLDAVPAWIKIDLGTSKWITKYTLEMNAGQQWKSWTLQGSDDNVSWNHYAGFFDNQPVWAANERRTFETTSHGSYRYWRWTITASHQSHAAINSIEPLSTLAWGATWGIGCGRVSSAGPVMLSRDGGPWMSTGATIPAGDTTIIAFGNYQGGGQPWGDVKEIIFVPYNFEGYRQLLEGYLAHKWGYTSLLPAGHPYKTTPP